MVREYSRTKSESLAQIRTIVAEIHTAFFLGDCFLLAHPVESQRHNQLPYLRISYCCMGNSPLA